MATGTLSPSPKQYFWNILTGEPLSGGLVYTVSAGGVSPGNAIATYQDAALTVPNSNPIVLNSAGYCVIYLTPGQSYKYIVTDVNGVIQWTQDGIQSVPGSASAVDIIVTAGENIAAEAGVYISDGSGGKTAGRAYNTSAANAYSSSAAGTVGLAIAAITSGAQGSVRIQGQLTTAQSFTPGLSYFASTVSGALITPSPANSRFIGNADSANSIVIAANPMATSATSALDVPVTAGEAIAAGNTLYLSDGSGGKTAGSAYNGDTGNPYSSSRSVVVGFAPAAISSLASGLMRLGGRITGLTGLVAGTPYYMSAAGAVTAVRPNNARLMGTADTTTSLDIQGPITTAMVPYFATLAPVQNTVAETAIIAFDISANEWADGDVIFIWMSTLNKNNKGSTGTVTAKVNAGAGGQVTLSGAAFAAGAWQNSATEFQAAGFACVLQRVGADIWVVGPGLMLVPLSGGLAFGPWVNGAPAIDGLSTPTNFTSTFTVSVKVTLSAADATFYLKPQSVRIWRQVKG